jgi:hypothetical protein
MTNAEFGKSFDREWAGTMTIGRIETVEPIDSQEIDIPQYWVRANTPDIPPHPFLFSTGSLRRPRE